MYGHGAGASSGGAYNGDRSSGDRNSGGNGGRFQKKKKNGGVGHYRGNGGERNHNGGGSSGTHAAAGPWICFNPYTGQAQPLPVSWRPAGGAGLLGPRPAAPQRPYVPAQQQFAYAPPQQQAYTTLLAPLHGQAYGTDPPPPGTPSSHGAPAWDCSALMAALNNAAASSSSAGEWIMDSGATSHMVSNPGSSNQARDHTLQ
ncbi:5'-3' exoribonuclease 2-like [Triticum aestivum]|uniref:5'-3' exoribonuclease 2-like n=1 Tax=Triticum aestivum TaxID=4565 RepID=UPI001D034D7C|nr:5'-3' exoribonuclease 2-like [Triticum aestivum]